jgi:hypothetical protein
MMRTHLNFSSMKKEDKHPPSPSRPQNTAKLKQSQQNNNNNNIIIDM